ncbi:MAG: hypothetical protein AAF805_07950 [Planctomycetota bacterium]
MNAARLVVLTLATLAATPAIGQRDAPDPLTRVLASEAEVRATPMLERPNRIGHFYGNTVRRLHYRTLAVNRRHSDRPVARYFYVTR